MKIRARAGLATLAVALTGCAPGPAGPSASPGPSSSASSSPSATPSATPDAAALVIPGDCESLIPITVVHAQFASSFESIPSTLMSGDPVAQDFLARGGLTCVWGIPNSDAGFVSVFVADRGAGTDDVLVGQWQAAGLSECPPFLDACYYEQVLDDVGEYWNIHVLVEGFEMRLQGTTSSLDPLLGMARAASTSMGYV